MIKNYFNYGNLFLNDQFGIKVTDNNQLGYCPSLVFV